MKHKRRYEFCAKYGWKYYRMSAFKFVDGMLGDDEAKTLHDLAQSLPNRHVNVVEIGSWVGKSAIIISTALRSKEATQFFCVDPFDASSDERAQPRLEMRASGFSQPLWETFNANIRRFGNAKIIIPKRGLSQEIVNDWHDEVDMLFIDGNHEFEAVKRDFSDWSPFIKEGGIILFHDTYFESPNPNIDFYYKGPGQTVKMFLKNSPDWEEICFVQSLYCARKVAKN
jgi:predicted O-methyltransferase YrrM